MEGGFEFFDGGSCRFPELGKRIDMVNQTEDGVCFLSEEGFQICDEVVEFRTFFCDSLGVVAFSERCTIPPHVYGTTVCGDRLHGGYALYCCGNVPCDVGDVSPCPK